MTWSMQRLVLAFGLMLATAACRPLSNGYDRSLELCGASATANAPLLRLLAPDLSPLTPATVDAVLVGAGPATPISISSKGCVFIPATFPARGQLLFRAKDGASGAGLDLSDVGNYGLDRPLALTSTPSGLVSKDAVLGCAAATSVNQRVGYQLQSAPSTRLNYLRFTSQLQGPSGLQQVAPLAPVTLTDGAISLGADLPEGHYQLVMTLESAFDTAAGIAPKTLTCPFLLNRTAPSLELRPSLAATSGLPLPLAADVLEVAPGATLRLEAHDASATQIFYCLTPQTEGQPTKRCAAAFAATTANLFMPDAGLWSLEFYGVDAAGNRSATAQKTLAVVHGDRLSRLSADLDQVQARLDAHDPFASLPALLDAMAIHDQLPLAVERDLFASKLLGAEQNIGPRLREWQRYAANTNLTQDSLSYSHDGSRILVKADALNILGEDGSLRRRLPNVSSGVFLRGDQQILIQLSNSDVALLNADTGEQKLIWANARSLTSSADGAAFTAIVGHQILIAAQDGSLLAQRDAPTTALAESQAPVLTLSTDGKALAFTDERGVTVWNWSTQQTSGPFANPMDGATTCTLSAVTLGHDAQTVYLGFNDTTVNGPVLTVTNPVTQTCGLRRWHPLANVNELLTYTAANLKGSSDVAFTPNSPLTILLSQDEQRVFVTSDSSFLWQWSGDDPATGVHKQMGDNVTSKINAFAVVGNERVAAASVLLSADADGHASSSTSADAGGDLYLFDQHNDFLPGASVDDASLKLPHLTPGVGVVALAPSGTTLVTGDAQGKVRFWDTANLPFRSFSTKSTQPPQSSQAFFAFVSGTQSRTLTVVSTDGAAVHQIQTPTAISAFALLEGGAAVTLDGSSVTLWSAAGAAVDQQPVVGTHILAAGSQVVVQANAETTTYQISRQGLTLASHLGTGLKNLKLSSNGQVLASLTGVRGAEAFTLYSLPSFAVVLDHAPYQRAPAWQWTDQPFSSDGRSVVLPDGAFARIKDSMTGERIADVPLTASGLAADGVRLLSFAANGTDLIAVDANTNALLTLDRTGKVLATSPTSLGQMQQVVPAGAASPQSFLVGRGTTTEVSADLWTADGRFAYRLGDADVGVETFATTAASGSILSVSLDLQVQLWPALSFADYRTFLCGRLQAYLAVRSDDWAVQGAHYCGQQHD